MEEKITAWIARDEDGVIALFTDKPVKSTTGGYIHVLA